MSRLICVLTFALIAAGCGGKVEDAKPPAANVDQGRKETKSLQAADAVGYEGKAIRKKVDAALNANDARNQQLEQDLQKQE